MGLGVGLLLSAVGAVLAFAVNTTVSGVNIHTIGVILMIVGAIGLFVSLLWARRAAPLATFGRRETVVHERDVL